MEAEGQPASGLPMHTPASLHPICNHRRRVRATFYGLVPEGCTASECGDRVVEAPAPAPAGQPATLALTATYPKSGRFIVRVEVRGRRDGWRRAGGVTPQRLRGGASAVPARPRPCPPTLPDPSCPPARHPQVTGGGGRVATQDHALLVRKRGDPALALASSPTSASSSASSASAGAPCCRHTPGLVAHQLGRPGRDDEYRAPAAARQAAGALGWPAAYWEREDVEAERLFDYGQLAQPLPATGPASSGGAAAAASPLALLTCAATRLAGAGSPRLYGSVDALAPHSVGHGKRLALVPAGFSWATSTDQAGDRAGGRVRWAPLLHQKASARGRAARPPRAAPRPPTCAHLARTSSPSPPLSRSRARATGPGGRTARPTRCPPPAAAPAPPPARARARCSCCARRGCSTRWAGGGGRTESEAAWTRGAALEPCRAATAATRPPRPTCPSPSSLAPTLPPAAQPIQPPRYNQALISCHPPRPPLHCGHPRTHLPPLSHLTDHL